MRKIKILIPVKQPVGGIRTYLKYTYPHLERNNYAITIVSPDKKYLSQMLKDLDEINIEVLPTKISDSLYHFSKKIYTLIRTKSYDIIHSQGFTAGVASVLANFKNNIPHIMTSHDILRKNEFEGFNGYIKLKLLGIIFKNIDIIQSVSYDAQNNLEEYIPSLKSCKEKLKVIQNGIDSTHFSEPISYVFNINDRKNNLFTIGFIGRYMPQKGFLDLVEVADILRRRSNNFKFHILAVGSFSAFIREYKKVITKMGLTKYFNFVDFQENINNIMRKIDVLVMPSLWEACPILPMEALVCGTPIIAYSCIGLREVLQNTPAIMIDVNDTKGLANKIFEVWSNYTNVKKTFDDYVPEAKKIFDVKNCARELENEIIHLVESNGKNKHKRNLGVKT